MRTKEDYERIERERREVCDTAYDLQRLALTLDPEARALVQRVACLLPFYFGAAVGTHALYGGESRCEPHHAD